MAETKDGALGVQVGGAHYKSMKIQPFEFVHANQIPYAEGSIIYYVSRWRSKNGIEDLKKARHTLDLLIEAEEKAWAQAEQANKTGAEAIIHGHFLPDPYSVSGGNVGGGDVLAMQART